MKDLIIGLVITAGLVAFLFGMCLCSIGAMAAPSPERKEDRTPLQVTVSEAGAHYQARPRRRSHRSFWRDGKSCQRRIERRRVLRSNGIGTV